MSLCIDEDTQNAAPVEQLIAPETSQDWADETVQEGPQINVEYGEDVPADAEASPSC